jgi:hypothetical protein
LHPYLHGQINVSKLQHGFGAFHEYAVEYTSERIIFAVDTKPILNISTASKNLPGELGPPHFAEFFADEVPYYLILNTAVAERTGSWPKPVASSTVLPAHHRIDYVRVSQPIAPEVERDAAQGGGFTDYATTRPLIALKTDGASDEETDKIAAVPLIGGQKSVAASTPPFNFSAFPLFHWRARVVNTTGGNVPTRTSFGFFCGGAAAVSNNTVIANITDWSPSAFFSNTSRCQCLSTYPNICEFASACC